MVAPTMALNDAVTNILQQLLVEESLGILPSSGTNWPIYRVNTPDLVDNIITILETTGVQQGRYMTTGAYVDRPGFQILVRANDYDTGEAKARAISVGLTETLNIPRSITVNATEYMIDSISKTSGPIPLGKEIDSSKRYLFSINFHLSIYQT